MFNRSTSDARATHHRLLSPSRDAIRPAHPERGRETEAWSTSNVGRTSGRQRVLRTFPGLHRTQLRHLLTYLTAQVVVQYDPITLSLPSLAVSRWQAEWAWWAPKPWASTRRWPSWTRQHSPPRPCHLSRQRSTGAAVFLHSWAWEHLSFTFVQSFWSAIFWPKISIELPQLFWVFLPQHKSCPVLSQIAKFFAF